MKMNGKMRRGYVIMTLDSKSGKRKERMAEPMETEKYSKANIEKNHRAGIIWAVTAVLHGAVYLSGYSLIVLMASCVYIILMLTVLIAGEVRKKPVVAFEKLVFIVILHMILLFHDVFSFLFVLSIETGNFHAR